MTMAAAPYHHDQASAMTTTSRRKRRSFHDAVYYLVESADPAILAWVPNSAVYAFRIINLHRFVSEILPYWEIKDFRRFQEELYRHGFHRQAEHVYVHSMLRFRPQPLTCQTLGMKRSMGYSSEDRISPTGIADILRYMNKKPRRENPPRRRQTFSGCVPTLMRHTPGILPPLDEMLRRNRASQAPWTTDATPLQPTRARPVRSHTMPTTLSHDAATTETLRLHNTPAFLSSLYEMLGAGHDDIIRWSQAGTAFEICNADRLARELLPKYFRHGKFASFQRQLNMYGFRKWPKAQARTRTYSHDEFLQHQVHRLVNIKRGSKHNLYLISKTS